MGYARDKTTMPRKTARKPHGTKVLVFAAVGLLVLLIGGYCMTMGEDSGEEAASAARRVFVVRAKRP